MKTEEELCDFLGKDLNKIENLCRICLNDNLCNAVLISKDSEKDMEDVESLEAKLNMDKELSLWEKIAMFGRVKVKYEDDLLKYICEQCCYDVDVAYTFRVKCHKADSLLKRVLQTLSEGQYISECNIKYNTEFIEIPADADIKEFNMTTSENHFDDDYDNKDDLQIDDEENNETEKVLSKKQSKRIKDENKKVSKKKTEIKDKCEDDEEKKYVCKVCHKAWAKETSLINHTNKMHNEKKEKLGIVTGRGAERRIHCPECDFKCKRWQAFHNHMVTHTGAKPFKCEQCNKCFTQLGGLIYHKKTHSDTTYFTCQECGKQFKHKKGFNLHHKVHSRGLDFKCHICSKALKTQKILDEHIKRHLNIKDFSCEICGKCFVTRSELFIHTANHDKSAKFYCTICSYSTNTKNNLNLHNQRHSGIRPHKCDQCDYAGVTTTELQSHLLKHSKESKFSCSVCDMKFRHRNGIYKHMERKHGEIARKWNDNIKKNGQ